MLAFHHLVTCVETCNKYVAEAMIREAKLIALPGDSTTAAVGLHHFLFGVGQYAVLRGMLRP